MSEVVHNTPQEFWHPPAVQSEAVASDLAGVCDGCGSEFIAGARFCHVCGASRGHKATSSSEPRWLQYVELLRVLEFHSVKAWLGLPIASLVAFMIGMGCILAAIAVGIIYSAQNLADFQAIQLWRIQWLLAALVSFVAAILLRRTEPSSK